MPRKRRKEVAEELKRPARYADRTPKWLKELLDEEDKYWQAPKRVQLQFSKKDADKERQRHEAFKRRQRR